MFGVFIGFVLGLVIMLGILTGIQMLISDIDLLTLIQTTEFLPTFSVVAGGCVVVVFLVRYTIRRATLSHTKFKELNLYLKTDTSGFLGADEGSKLTNALNGVFGPNSTEGSVICRNVTDALYKYRDDNRNKNAMMALFVSVMYTQKKDSTGRSIVEVSIVSDLKRFDGDPQMQKYDRYFDDQMDIRNPLQKFLCRLV